MCDEAVDGTQVDVLLDESSDGVDMSGMVTVLDSRHVYQGAIFASTTCGSHCRCVTEANGDSPSGDASRALRGHAGA